ncbi:MAG: SGNH/GDSL hydrolase family protein [Edaphobacter sp.]
MRPSVRLIVLAAVAGGACLAGAQVNTTQVPVDDHRIEILGRYAAQADASIRLGYPGIGIVARFRGTSLSLRLNSSSATSALTVIVDHGEPRDFLLKKGQQTVPLVEHAGDGPHTVAVYKRTETWQGLVDLQAVVLDPGEELLQAPPLPVRKLIFLGDSVTCGAAVDVSARCSKDPGRPNGDPYHSYGMNLGRRLDAQTDLVCYGGRGLQRDYRGLTIKDSVVNVPDFFDLAVATDDASTRAPWDARSWTPDGIVVSLGTNDFNLEATKPLNGQSFVADYVGLLRRMRAEYPNAEIFATEGSMVTNPLLRQWVREAVTEMNDAHVEWAPGTYYPGDSCSAHPTREQHEHMADDLEPLLRTRLHW